MRSGWQARVREACPQHEYIDPTDRNGIQLDDPREYAAWDAAGIGAADIVFAYWERDNPSGIGLAVELGIAKGSGKLVVLVDERAERYGEILRALADVLPQNLSAGMKYLSAITW